MGQIQWRFVLFLYFFCITFLILSPSFFQDTDAGAEGKQIDSAVGTRVVLALAQRDPRLTVEVFFLLLLLLLLLSFLLSIPLL